MKSVRPLTSAKTGPLSGTAVVPGDKSMSHRALMLGLLARGETMISGLLESEDVLATADAVRQMGAEIRNAEDGLWRVFGVGVGNLKDPADVLDMGNAGTAARLIMGMIAGHDITATMTGDASLRKRPMKRVIKPLGEMGAQCLARGGDRLPLTIAGTAEPHAIDYTLPVASAQVKSAILLAGLTGKGKTIVREDRPSRDHTERMLTHFGAEIETAQDENGHYVIQLQGGQSLFAGAVDIPGDPSSAAFPAVAAAIVPGSEIRLKSVGLNDRRTGLFTVLEEMGVEIHYEDRRDHAGEPVADLRIKGPDKLAGVDVPASLVPVMIDEFPVLAMAAACADGTTRMTGLGELRVKESDRLQLVADGLRACGVDVEDGEDSLTVKGTGRPPAGGAVIATELDHRIAMSFLVLGTVTDDPVEIDDGGPIATSFPNFVDLMNELGADIRAPGEADIRDFALS